MKTLNQKLVYISRSRNQSPDEIGLLEENGAEVIAFPTISIDALMDTSAIDDAIRNLKQYNFIIFTSINAVKYFIVRAQKLGITIPASISVVAVGKKTQRACKKYGVEVSLVPDKYSAKGVIEMLKGKVVSGTKILVPASIISRNELADGLKELGADVSVIPVYSNSTINADEFINERTKLKKTTPDVFIFSSPSSFTSFLNVNEIEQASEYFSERIVAAIGNTTKHEIEKSKVNVNIVPEVYTLMETIKKILKFYNDKLGV